VTDAVPSVSAELDGVAVCTAAVGSSFEISTAGLTFEDAVSAIEELTVDFVASSMCGRTVLVDGIIVFGGITSAALL